MISKYTYDPTKQNVLVLLKSRAKPAFSLGYWNISKIGQLTDYIFNPFVSMSKNGNTTQDNAIRSVLPESLIEEHEQHKRMKKKQQDNTIKSVLPKQQEKMENLDSPNPTNIPFEIAPWIAALAASNAGVSKKRVSIKNRYATTIGNTSKLLNHVDHLKHYFGYPFIHSSLGFHYAHSLVNGNQYMGTNILGELVSALNTSKSVEDSSTSINLINMMIEQFAISHSIYNMDSQNAVLNELSSGNIFNGLQNLDYESEITNDLSTEITNFINQVYMTHPFSTDGVSMYLKPLASQRYLSSRSLNFFPYKKNGSTNASVGHVKFSNPSNSSTPGSVHIKLTSSNLNSSPIDADNNVATSFVKSVFDTFNENNATEIDKFNLINKLNGQEPVLMKNLPASLEEYFKFDNNAEYLIGNLNKNPSDTLGISQLFTSMDKYLTDILLPQAKPNPLPLQALSGTIEYYDQHKNDVNFDSHQAKQQLLKSLTDSADTIIQYYNQWKAYVNNRFQDSSDDISNIVDQLRPVADLLQHIHDNSYSWNNQISNH